VNPLRLFLCWLALQGAVTPQDLAPHLDDVLQIMALTRSDLAITKDYLPDPDRLSITRQLMRDPLSAESWLEGIGGRLGSGDDIAGIGVAIGLLGGDSAAVSRSGEFCQIENLEAYLKHVSPTVQGSSPEPFPKRDLLDLVHPHTTMSAPIQDALLDFGRSIPTVQLLSIVAGILKQAQEDSLLNGRDRVERERSSFNTPFGRVSIGSEQDDVYEHPHLLIIDPGGNDVYIDVAGVSSAKLPVSVTIDFSGSDRYEGSCATGRSGIGILIDLAGSDRYAGGSGTQASGLGGVGLLIDRRGDDVYDAGIGAQGFGLYGAGILIDAEGNDRYSCDLLGQGAAGPGGIGLVLDRAGDDTYRAGGPFPDFRESGAYSRSMSQGFSYGLQTEASGGVGLLVDLAGADRYEVEYFGQGASFWAGLGALYDREGDDVYAARRYAQGCGLHMSVGILVDRSGNDVYSVWGVGQGAGHDLSVGVLADIRGNDRFEATWMAQGVGNGNGTGVLVDRAGDDVFAGERDDTQGYGIGARGFGSIGILLDLKGLDQFRIDDQRRIVVSGDLGARYDVAEGVER
jgi:hypothetical protein